MSHCHQQEFIDAPIEVVWRLIADIERHPEWWPRVIDVECDGLEAGCTYREIVHTPLGRDEMRLLIEGRDELRSLRIRCLSTGTFVRFRVTGAQDGTFVDGEMGMDPAGIGHRVFDAVAGRRYFASWMRSTLEALARSARDAAPAGRSAGAPAPSPN